MAIYIARLLIITSFAIAGIANASHESQLDAFTPKIHYCSSNLEIPSLNEAIKCKYLARNEIKFKQDLDLIKWAKIEIHSPTAKQIAIYVSPHFLNEIELYEKVNERWVKQIAGSNLTSNDPQNVIGGYYFLSEVTHYQDRTFYLKIKGSGLNNLDIAVTSWPSTDPISSSWKIAITAQLAGLGLILIFAIFSYLATPTIVMWRFCLLMICLIFCTLSGSGILAKYFLVSMPHLDGPLFVIFLSLRVALWTWVSQAFFIGYRTPLWYKYACNSVYIATVISMLDVTLELAGIFQPLLLVAFITVPVIQLLGVLNTNNIEMPLKGVLAWGFMGASLLVLMALITNIYPFSDRPLPTYISRATDFVNPIILLAIIQYQYRQIRNDLTKVKELLVASNLEKEFEKQLVSERRVLIDMLTHELKNPLASINMAVGTLKNSFNQNDLSELRRIENISKSVKNMDLVIERVSFMNALDQKNIKPEGSHFLLNDLLESIINDFPSDSPITIEASQRINIYTDPQFLKLILLNLIDNALKYSPKSSKVVIKTSEKIDGNKKIILIGVTNLIEEHLRPDPEMLFTRYYRHEGANAISGSGLGLSLVKAIANIVDAQIQYQDDRSSITFTVMLKNE